MECDWEIIIGLEVHAQLTTKSKLFSGSSTDFGNHPNTQANIVDLAMPGTLPVLNHEAINKACLFGLAVNATIAEYSCFDRKNYFYPDLPKGYQISQLFFPIVQNGYIDIAADVPADPSTKRIRINRAHLEEDAGKSLHEEFQGMTGIDLNRAGTPLLEIVTEPDLRSAKEVISYLKKLHQLIVWLEICDGNMSEGSFRCDANVSVRKVGDPKLGTRAEIKNINSFKNIELAINYETNRQIFALENGNKIIQETRLYDADKNETRSMRSKEEANDYRYFQDPDLLPLHINNSDIETIKKNMPELPEHKKNRFMTEFQLSEYDADLLTSSRAMSEYFEKAEKIINQNQNLEPKIIANWIIGDLQSSLNKHSISIEKSPISSSLLSALLLKIGDSTLSTKSAKDAFNILWESSFSTANRVDEFVDDSFDSDRKYIDDLIEKHSLQQITDLSTLQQFVNDTINNNAKQVTQFRQTQNPKLLGFFVGQIMKLSNGKANPEITSDLVMKKLLDPSNLQN